MRTEDITREARLRRMAKRQLLELRKSPRRDERAYDYGTYMLVDRDNRVIASGADGYFGLDMDEIEKALNE